MAERDMLQKQPTAGGGFCAAGFFAIENFGRVVIWKAKSGCFMQMKLNAGYQR